jgi:hypothetical protein
MPTSTFTITANANDGSVLSTTSVTNTSLNTFKQGVFIQTYSNFGVKESGWLYFNGITIPQGTTINSAVLSTNMGSSNGNTTTKVTLPFLVGFKGTGSPAVPTNINDVLNASFASVTRTVTSVPITTVYKYNSPTGPVWYPENSQVKTMDVTALVQSLVTAYDYDNGKMLVRLNRGPGWPSVVSTGPSTSTFKANAVVFQRDSGAQYAAKLIIDYEGGSTREPDKTSYRYG